MEPIIFPESNKPLLPPPGMANCITLHVFNDGEKSVSCWRPSWLERLSILFFGRVWLTVWFGTSQPPVWISGERTVFVKPRRPAPAADVQ